jgi:hypothetical protein
LALSLSWIIQIIAWTQLSVINDQPGAVGYPMWNYAMSAMDGVWIFFGVCYSYLKMSFDCCEFTTFVIRIYAKKSSEFTTIEGHA